MIKNLSLIGISCLVTLLMFEVVLRLFFPVYLTGHVRSFQYDKDLGVRLKSDTHIFHTTDYQQEVKTNPYGTVNFNTSFEGYRTKIMTIGDSYTMGTGLPSDANYPFQLDILL